jgi:hypothetical protein
MFLINDVYKTQNYKLHIIICIRFPSLFCVFSFVLPACRPNFAKVALTAQKIEEVWSEVWVWVTEREAMHCFLERCHRCPSLEFIICTHPRIIVTWSGKGGWYGRSIRGQYEKEGLRSSGMLRGVRWQLVTDIAVQAIGPILKGQTVQEEYNETSGVINRWNVIC